MANRKIMLPQYGTVMKRGVLYYRTRIKDANGKLVAIYAKTPEELYNKETLALEQIENATFHRKTPTVAEYCEKWLLMQSVHVRATTLTDYTSKVRRHIIAELGDKRMGEVSLDDIQLALVPVSKKSASVYKSVVILYKSIFRAAMESRIIDHNPTIYLTTKGGGVPQEDRQALTDEQAAAPFGCYPRFAALCLCHDWFVCRAAPGRNSCSAMGFSISGYGYSISDGKAGMAHRTQQTGDLRRIENQGCGEKYPPSCLLG